MVSIEEKQKIRAKYNFRPFVEAPPSKENVEILDIQSLDLSKFDEGFEARKELANKLEKSLTTYGFFKLINHGFSHEFLETMKSISLSTFNTTDDVKEKFFAGKTTIEEDENLELGVIRGSGYKPRGYWTYTNEAKDNVEFFNFRHFLHHDIFNDRIEYPEFVKANLDDIENYFATLHKEVQRKVLTLMDIILEFPEGKLYNEYFPAIENDVHNSGTGFGRFLLYHPVDDDYNKRTTSTWLRGHSDAGGLTFILSQSILSLQVRTYDDNRWKYVSHTPDALIVNVGDTLKFLTGGYFRSSIHRVHTAPKDQQNYQRGTIIYFASPKLDVFMDPEELNSPKLKRLGFVRDLNIPRITVRDWDEAKGQFFNKTDANRKTNVSILGRESVGSLIGENPIEA
jgi:isopenicillin N synthase-like dioxygenase